MFTGIELFFFWIVFIIGVIIIIVVLSDEKTHRILKSFIGILIWLGVAIGIVFCIYKHRLKKNDLQNNVQVDVSTNLINTITKGTLSIKMIEDGGPHTYEYKEIKDFKEFTSKDNNIRRLEFNYEGKDYVYSLGIHETYVIKEE